MKKTLILTGLIVSTSLTLTDTTFADSKQPTGLPPEFSVLSTSELSTLATLTGSARDEFLSSKGITRPDGVDHKNGTGSRSIPFEGKTALTDEEKSALDSMTDSERQVFFASKDIAPNTATGNIASSNLKRNALTAKASRGTTNNTLNSSVSSLSRAERITQNKEKLLATKKAKMLKKIQSGETLTRLEQKFADTNNIEY